MRILMIEDDKELVKATTLQLKHEGYDVDYAFDGEEGLFCLTEGKYDIVILDRMLPELDGVSLLKKIRKKGNKVPVLMLTALGGIGDRVSGLDTGADDYMIKPFDIKELCARLRALSRRPSEMVDSMELRYSDIMLDANSLYLEGNKGRCILSKKESDLLEILIKNSEKTLSRSMLFTNVWGIGSEVEEGNLDSYAHFVRRRLSAVSKKVCLTTVRGVGYRLESKE